MTIPVKNLFYMLAYAWNILDVADESTLSVESVETPQDLLARIFCVGLQSVAQRGLERSYQEISVETFRPSGKFEIHHSITHAPRLAGRVIVSQDEYSDDCSSNRALLATLRFFLEECSLGVPERESLRRYLPLFGRVKFVPLKRVKFNSIRMHRNNLYYLLALHVAELVKDRKLYSEGDGHQLGISFDSSKLMWKVFEKFVLNFLAAKQVHYKVKSRRIDWQNVSGNSASLNLIPQLHPDIFLESAEHLLIIDTKYYQSALDGYHRDSLKASHVYQLFSYVENFSKHYRRRVDGVMLYPRVEKDLDVRFEIEGRQMRFVTLDLTHEWPSISQNLLGLVESFGFLQKI